jgi:hypothetical protein
MRVARYFSKSNSLSFIIIALRIATATKNAAVRGNLPKALESPSMPVLNLSKSFMKSPSLIILYPKVKKVEIII